MMLALLLSLLLGVALGVLLILGFADPLGFCGGPDLARFEQELRKPAP
jgi:hypothetical protein